VHRPGAYNYWHGQINPVIFLLLAISYCPTSAIAR